MQMGKALLLGLGLLAVSLSGCSSGGDADGFSIKALGNGKYTFTASAKADNYTWDLGDRLTQLYGKSVTHTYDFQNGKINVVLASTVGGKKTETRKDLTLGAGVNGEATFVLEGSQNWTILGETLKLSAAASTDPDGDALRYSWSCVRTGDAVRTAPHSHGFGGVPYATPPAGQVTARLANNTLPAADKTYDGDLCEALGTGSRPSLDATIEGKFTNTGVYDIYLLASDPVHPSTSGKFHFVVTKPEERPNATLVFPFEGTFQGGAGGSVAAVCEALQQCTDIYDRVQHPFSLPLLGLGGTIDVQVTDDPSTQAGLSWVLNQGSTENIDNGSDGVVKDLDANVLRQGSYTLDITLEQGVQVGYTAVVTVQLDMDPFKVY